MLSRSWYEMERSLGSALDRARDAPERRYRYSPEIPRAEASDSAPARRRKAAMDRQAAKRAVQA